MAMLSKSFSIDNVAAQQSRDPIPAGKYLAQVVASEFKDTKAGTGQYLKLEFDILDGEACGRKIWTNLNLNNPNPKAVEIAEETLRDICMAIGRVGCNDSEELHLQPMAITIKVVPAGPDRQGTYREASNEVSGYAKAQQGGPRPAPVAARPAPAPVAAPAPAPAPANTMPWRMKTA